jgi:hypothetical protein
MSTRTRPSARYRLWGTAVHVRTPLTLVCLVGAVALGTPAQATETSLVKRNCSPVAAAGSEFFFNERQANGLFDARVGGFDCQGRPLLPPHDGHRGVADARGRYVLFETAFGPDRQRAYAEPGRGFGVQLQLLDRQTGGVSQLTTERKGIIWAKLHPSGQKVMWAEMLYTQWEPRANWWHNLLGVWEIHVADLTNGRLANERSWRHQSDLGFMESYGWLDDNTVMFATDSGMPSNPWGDWLSSQLWTMPDSLQGSPTRWSRPFTVKAWDWAAWRVTEQPRNPYHEFMQLVDGWLYFSVVWEYDLTGKDYDVTPPYNGLDLWRARPDGTGRERVTSFNLERFAHVGGLAHHPAGGLIAGVCSNISCEGDIDAYRIVP